MLEWAKESAAIYIMEAKKLKEKENAKKKFAEKEKKTKAVEDQKTA